MRAIKAIPNPDVAVADTISGRMRHAWHSWLSEIVATLLNRVPVTGSVTFTAGTTKAVTFATPEADANYDVWYAWGEENYGWTTSKATTGFTANCKNSSSATVRYQIIRA